MDILDKWTNKHQMTINAKSENITIDDLPQAAQDMKIKPEMALIGNITLFNN